MVLLLKKVISSPQILPLPRFIWLSSKWLCAFCAANALQKNQRELAKMKKCLRPEELVSHMGQMDTQAQQEELEKSYQITVEDYRRIIERLASQAWSDSEMLLAWEHPPPHPPAHRWPVLSVWKPHITTDLRCDQEEPPRVQKKSLLIGGFKRIVVSGTRDMLLARWPACFQLMQCTLTQVQRETSRFSFLCVLSHSVRLTDVVFRRWVDVHCSAEISSFSSSPLLTFLKIFLSK